MLLCLLAIVRLFALSPFSVPTGSMRHTLEPGDHVLVDRVSQHFRDVRRGDVVVVDAADLLVSQGRRYVVKRVVGVGGDRVVCCDGQGRLLVNGVPQDEGRYLFPGDAPSTVTFDVSVPRGRLWLLGDHRSRSEDSRALLGQPGGGLIDEHRLVGRVVAVAWPADRWRWVH
ncbi:MAG: signal peptidase I [Actinomycetes bacterium]